MTFENQRSGHLDSWFLVRQRKVDELERRGD